MSGTSMDGIDVAVIETDGRDVVRRLAFESTTFDEAFRGTIRQALADAANLTDRTARPGCLGSVEVELTQRHAIAVDSVLRNNNWQASDIDLIGFHGQTVLHRPEQQLTIQIGDGSALASVTGIPVIYDMRARDVACGGQGAPMASAYHRAMVSGFEQKPVAVLNIGGVANVTWIGPEDDLVAFDTGPGNALIDDWMMSQAGRARDEDGKTAAGGQVDHRVLDQLCKHRYFQEPPPKSLDRNDFTRSPVNALSPADGAATLTAFTARSIAMAQVHMPASPALWMVCGGGRKNRTLMRLIAEAVDGPLFEAEARGFGGDAVEAEAWAYLAVRSREGLALTFPGTTGISAPTSGGMLATP